MSVNFGSYLITNGKMNSAQNNSENCNTISVSFLFFLFDFFFENTEILKYEILTEKVLLHTNYVYSVALYRMYTYVHSRIPAT